MTGSTPNEVLDELAAADVVRRIWRRDHTVWKDDPAEIADRLGWLTAADETHARIDDLEAFAKEASADGLETVVLLGMGGSSLAPEVFARTFGPVAGHLDLIVLDTTHPSALAAVERRVDGHTLFVVASKSGTTIETRSHLAAFWERTGGAAERFVAITDPGTPLEDLARGRGFREVFVAPPDVGGRYSALTWFGIVPAALLGAPLHELVGGAREKMRASADPSPRNDAAALGAALGAAARAGRDKMTLVLPGAIAALGDWVEQLVAESTGKEGTGILPVVGEDLGPPEVYGRDRIFVAYGDHEGLEAIEAAGAPIVRLGPGEPSALGAEMFRWQFATAVAGHVLGIQPFDQPDVATAKDATSAILDEGYEDPGLDDLAAVLAAVGPGDYLAITAFVDPTEETRAHLQRTRLALRDRFAVATTLGFGPRYLHSTGQLHKGGPNTGVFIQVVDDARPVDAGIPGESFTFGQLLDAQALGDLRSLRAAGRRVARVTLDTLLSEVG